MYWLNNIKNVIFKYFNAESSISKTLGKTDLPLFSGLFVKM